MLVIVLFHAGLAGLVGGFIGVDVFFVISGFLITGLLVRERQGSGTIGLQQFYARRVRRLLPAAVVALIVTLVAASLIVAPLDRADVATDGAAAALSIANIRFALSAGDYFATAGSPSPFLHFWSLGVEEQFYLVWPALLILVAWRGNPVRRIGTALVVVFIASFAANLLLTDAAANWAFYSLPTRAWQLALGGLVAVGVGRIAAVPRPILGLVGWLGLGGIAIAAVGFDSGLSYPGAAALLPTVGAAALLASGSGRFGPARLLSVTPLRFLGRISYSLYLWHWPILILAPLALGTELGGVARLGLVAVSVAIATASWAFIETPFRNGPLSLRLRPVRTVSFGVAALAAVVLLSTGLSPATIDPAAAANPAGTVFGDEAAFEVDAPWTEPTPKPDFTVSPTSTIRPTSTPAHGPSPTAVPDGPIALLADVKPALGKARTDEERLRRDGCLAFERETTPPDCVYGDREGTFTVALVGDSHAAQWFPALERLAKHEGWRVLTFVKVSCPFIDMRVRNLALKREYRECAAFNDAVVARLASIRPDLTLVSISRTSIHPVSADDDTVDAKGSALGRMVGALPGKVAIIIDTPTAGGDVPACLSEHADDVRACAVAPDVAFGADLGRLEVVAAEASRAETIDLTATICVGTPCPVVVDGLIVFRDAEHLTATFSRSLAPALGQAIESILK